MPSVEALIHLITGLGILAVILVIFAESGLLFGFFLPGDSLLFTAGFLVYQGIFPINIHLFVLLLFIAAALGDTVGYTFGYRVGRKLFDRPNSRFFKKSHLEKAEEFYKKYGALAIVLARFVPIVRTFAPIIAGVSRMHYPTFATFNILGGFAWVSIFTYLGYYIGQQLTDMGISIEVIALTIIFLSVLPIIIPIVKNKDHRTQIWAAAKRQIQTVFRRRNR